MQKIIYYLNTILLLMGLISGCKTMSNQEPLAALIPLHTNESITELRSVVTKALYGTSVTIAKTAFNNSNRLILERKKIRAADGRVIDTRVDQEPYIFELWLINGDCYLHYQKNSQKYLLKSASCSLLNN
ncbi:MAG: hypothetical protein GY829_12985 [Gammaproteobacteria bacterium]|nr:hypothetical protein [Gammaproteobacteria bacterium]